LSLQDRRRKNRRKQQLCSKTTKVVASAAGATGVFLAAQAVYVGLTTPRLPPPAQSAHDFERDGLVVVDDSLSSRQNGDTHCRIENASKTNDTSSFTECCSKLKNMREKEEICVMLIGDSPVEGIGNPTHDVALGGQTARAFSRLYHKPVRYWSYGKSGLTTRGVQTEMVPLMKQISKKRELDVVIVSCGVNNTLRSHSAETFGRELNSLLHSIFDYADSGGRSGNENRKPKNVTVILIGLIDFSYLPFLPWPLSSVLGWRSRSLQAEMERVVEEWQKIFSYNTSRFDQQQNKAGPKIVIANMPRVEDILNNHGGGIAEKQHPLLQGIAISDSENDLDINDFFADDGFHPAKNGTIMVGNMLAQTYHKLLIES